MAYFKYKNEKVYYKVKGNKTPLIFLAGNTASGKMFNAFFKYFKKDYKVITVDFPGHGKSERLDEFPVDFWYENALCVIELIKHLGLDKVNLIGTSGGALVALNVALEAPELVSKVIADSFEGEKSLERWAKNVREYREKDKQKLMMKVFWRMMHGRDWRKVVDQDTDMMEKHHAQIGEFFHKELSTLKCEVLLTGSEEDEYITNIGEIFAGLNIQKKSVHLFKFGGHPAIILASRQEFVKVAREFLKN